WLMMSLWDALRMNMMISYQELVRTFLRNFPGINIHNFYTNDARVRHLHPLIPYYGSVFIFK
ncbi:hypothetical protein ACJWUN_24665, partial [Klebsiella pneumoniae]|uniref:hypothetical protein n=1 Tax=Klebsiella pneumoniae TaxID=573 RepID=UPI0029642F6D